MTPTGEQLLLVLRRAVDATGVDPRTEDVIARRRLEAAIEHETREMTCCNCGGFDWD